MFCIKYDMLNENYRIYRDISVMYKGMGICNVNERGTG